MSLKLRLIQLELYQKGYPSILENSELRFKIKVLLLKYSEEKVLLTWHLKKIDNIYL